MKRNTDSRTVHITFRVSEAQWKAFEKLTVRDAVEQILGTTLTRKKSRLNYTEIKPIGFSYVTRSSHRYLKKGTPCVVQRSGAGYLVVRVLAKYLSPKANSNSKRPEEYVTMTFNGLWYIQGKEKPKLYVINKKGPLRRSRVF